MEHEPSHEATPRMPTVIAGSDEIVDGGLPQEGVTVVLGGAGAVKTTLDTSSGKTSDGDLTPPDFRELFEAAPGLYLVLTPAFVIVGASDNYLRATNTHREDVIGRGLFAVFPDNPEDSTATGTSNLRESLEHVLREGVPDTMAVQKYDIPRPQTAGGGFEERYWSPINLPVFRVDGTVKWIIHRVEDVTELVHLRRAESAQTQPNERVSDGAGRMEAEVLRRAQEIQEANRRLRAANEQITATSEWQFRALFDFMPQLGWTARADGFVDWYNRGWYEYTGTTPDEMVGWGWTRVHDPEMLPKITERWQHSIDTGTPFEMEFKLRRHDDAFRWFLTRVTPMRDADGRVVRWVGINTDIDDRRRADGERTELLRLAESAGRAKDEFLAMLGHELRNPLAPILTALQLMRSRGSDSDRDEKERTVIERQVSHMVCLVDDLLDLSRIAQGKLELKRKHIELAEVVARAIESASPLLEQRRHRVSVTVPREGVMVDADPVRLAQVVSNLLTNAAKFTEPNGEIAIIGELRDGQAILRVRDTGVGIAPDLLPTVFDAFVQERQAVDRSRGGLGLGLAIVRSIVRAHGGDVGASSEGNGRGAEFTLRLPAVVASTPQMMHVAEAAKPIATRPCRVLVVDDNEDAAFLMSELLRVGGYEVEVAFDGPSALQMLDAFMPDAALLDIGLPVMDGFELARCIRARFPKALLVAVTGYGQAEDRVATRAAGFDVHLVKPIDIADVTRVLEGAAPAATAR